MISAIVFGRENCGICKSAAEKFDRMNIPYQKENIDKFTQIHDGWREDDSVAVMSAMCANNQHIPIIKLLFDDGTVKYTSYVEAMAMLKKASVRGQTAAAE